MKTSLRPALWAALACVAGVFSACDLEEPSRYIRPPIIKSFSPQAPSLTTAVGDTVDFSISAMDPDALDLDYSFVLGDSVTETNPEWTYVVDDTGRVDVLGRVSNRSTESVIRWRLTRVFPVNLPPQIVSVDPPEPMITIILGNSIDFSIAAIDPEGKELSYVYTIGDSIVGVSRKYTYRSYFVGVVSIRAVASDGESFVSYSWTLRVAAEPDFVAPAKVIVFSAEPGAETGEVDIEWIAVGDDSMAGLPSYYVLRSSPMPITDEHAWNSSSEREGEGAPAVPGDIMRMTVRDLPPAQTVYFAVRAVDDFGNLSPLSDLAYAKSRGMQVFGTVRDALTGGPIEGVRVKLLSIADTTNADGSFALKELTAGVSYIAAEDDPFRTEIGNYFDVVITPYQIRDKDVVDIWMLPNIALETAQYTDFLSFYVLMTELEGAPKDLLDRWDLPCRVYVPPFEKNGLDYDALIRSAFRDWETAVGFGLFEFVESVPDTGVFIVYLPEASPDRESYLVTRQDPNGLQIQGRISVRTIYYAADSSAVSVVMRHEIGHALGMNHSLDPNHLMVEGRFPTATHPTPDEVRLGMSMYRIPRNSPADWFRFD